MPTPPPPSHRSSSRGDVDIDDARHRREAAERRAKRKSSKSSHHGSEKDRKRREHVKRTLEEQKRQEGGHHSSSREHRHKRSRHSTSPGKSPSKDSSSGTTSAFQSMFSQRAEGFKIEFTFRNAPPRPPVGPCFVGQGLEGQLQDLAVYRPMNAVEVNHSWKLHAEQDLGVPLAPSAMDLHMYEDAIAKKKKMKQRSNSLLVVTPEESSQVEEPLHPDDEALVHWKGPMGDTAAEKYQKSKDRERAAARLALKKGGKQLSSSINDLNAKAGGTNNNNTTQQQFRSTKKKKEFSRVLDRGMDFKFMKKTTYVANDFSRKVHDFTSLAATKAKEAVDLQDRQNKVDRSSKAVEKTFEYHYNNGAARKLLHPTKKHLKPVWELPLLPNIAHWGDSYTHVVLDNPPKPIPAMQSPRDIAQALPGAFVANVIQKSANERATCQLMLPMNNHKKANVIDDDDDQQQQHRPIAQYDLDVIPLKGEGCSADTNFCLWIDVEGGLATYLPVPSKINLTTGRPSKKAATNVNRRPLTEEERNEIIERTAQVDHDFDTTTNNNNKSASKESDDDDDNEGEETIKNTTTTTRQAEEDLNDDFGDEDSSDEDSDE